MSRLILAAGVAALAIAGAAAAKPGGGGGDGNPRADNGSNPHGGGDGGHGHGEGGAAPAMMGGGEERGHGRGGDGGFAPQQPVQRQQFRAPPVERMERQQFRAPQPIERQQARAFEGQQEARFKRQQAREQARVLARQQARLTQQAELGDALRHQPDENRLAARGSEVARVQRLQQQQLAASNPALAERVAAFRNAQTSFAGSSGRGLIDVCPPGLSMKNNGCAPPGQAAKLLGQPLGAASAIAPLYALPHSVKYLYPDTPNYYYRYGDGYLYQVNRGTNLIDSLLPLIGGGYVPGQYLPQPYMGSYVPDYYGMNAFYPDYGDTCNRYANGVIYEVDCATGYVEDVIPIYESGYGVGQMLPSAYSYYNVPMQYRSMYYDTPNAGYWYAPGAIYQYDPRSSMITSVAALMAPGFTVGKALPLGYDAYNVPYGYRSTYYDTPNAWYRYNNGYIYQVDPVTQIVTAIVASLLS